jgi:hypothetical protein
MKKARLNGTSRYPNALSALKTEARMKNSRDGHNKEDHHTPKSALKTEATATRKKDRKKEVERAAGWMVRAIH